jgi:hypothetical protein
MATWLTGAADGGALADGAGLPQAHPVSTEHSTSDAALRVRSPRVSAILFGCCTGPMERL